MDKLTRAGIPLALCLYMAGVSAQPVLLSSGDGAAFEVDLALAADQQQLLAAWYEEVAGDADIYLRFFDTANGEPVSAAIRLRSEANAYEPELVPYADGFALAWYEVDSHGSSQAHIAWLDAAGTVLALQALGPGSRSPALTGVDDQLLVVWLQGDGQDRHVRGQWFSAARVAKELPAELGAADDTWKLSTQRVGDSAWVVFDSRVAVDRRRLVRIAWVPGQLPRIDSIPVPGAELPRYPELLVSAEGMRVGLLYSARVREVEEIRLAEYTRDDWEAGSTAAPRAVATGYLDAGGAYGAAHGDRWWIAWHGRHSSPVDDHYRLRWATVAGTDPEGAVAAGMAISSPDRDAFVPSVLATPQAVWVAWNEVEGLATPEVRSVVRIYRVDSTPDGSAAVRDPKRE